jgi:hypothetical protein
MFPRGGCRRAALSLTKKSILSQVGFARLNRGLLSVITDESPATHGVKPFM